MNQIKRRENKVQSEQSAVAPDGAVPTRWAAMIFVMKASFLRIKRLASEVALAEYPKRHILSDALLGQPILSRSETQLWNARSLGEQELVLGKVHNLRKALGGINGIEVPSGQVVSFWRQLGRPTRLRGFAKGRELRQGCLIPSMGGGLCQLSNALYQCALDAGFEIVERHAHSKIVPGSLAERGLDATVFWNYVDLRFKSSKSFRIEAFLTRNSLIVQFRGKSANEATINSNRTPTLYPTAGVVKIESRRSRRIPASLPVHPVPEPHSCTDCGVTSCFRNAEAREPMAGQRTAFLVDEFWPEFDQYIQSVRRSGDVLAIPMNGGLLRRKSYAWTTTGFSRVKTLTAVSVLRGRAIRRLPRQGAALQSTKSRYDERLARGFAHVLTPDVTDVVVSQNLLPALWMGGHLGGRTFDVLMTRLPMLALERELDRAHVLHPESSTLTDFREHGELKRAEDEALAEARSVITPHAEIAGMFGTKALRLDWQRPPVVKTFGRSGDGRRSGRAVLFPASTLARKGAYELREAARILELEIVLMGSVIEDAGFWKAVKVRQADANWLDTIDAVCLPAFVASEPRKLLDAVAHGTPVIATPACGLDGVDNVITVQAGDVPGLVTAIRNVLEAHRVCGKIERLAFCRTKTVRSYEEGTVDQTRSVLQVQKGSTEGTDQRSA